MNVKGFGIGVLATAVAIGWEKLVVAVAALVGVTVLGVTGHVGSDAVVGLYSAVIGYVLGAGTTAARGS